MDCPKCRLRRSWRYGNLVGAATVPYEFFDAVAYREKNKSEISTKRGIKTGIANLQV
jgi:hypothetical protein